MCLGREVPPMSTLSVTFRSSGESRMRQRISKISPLLWLVGVSDRCWTGKVPRLKINIV